MIAGDLAKSDPILITGFKGFPDFYPQLIADNLRALGIPSNGIALDLPVLKRHRYITSRILANLFEDPEFRVQIATTIKATLKSISPDPERIGFPAVLGLTNSVQVLHDLEDQLGLPVFEIPTLPPSIPGIRLNTMLIAAIEGAGGHVFDGIQAVSADAEKSRLKVVWSEAAARLKPNRATNYVLATGGILGGGLQAGYDGQVVEMICAVPIQSPENRLEWLHEQFLSPEPHPVFQTGVNVDHNLQPISTDGQIIYKNLYAIGTGLSGGDYLRERSFNGIALVTGYVAGRNL